MARIENTAEGARHMHVQTDKTDPGTGRAIVKLVEIPAAQRADDGRLIPGTVEIPDELLAMAMKDDVVKAWFAEGGCLRVVSALVAKTEKQPAKDKDPAK